MQFAKRLLMVFGAVMLAGIVGVLLTPKALHAVATAVQIVNPPANPVPTVSTDNHARTAVLLSADVHILDGQNSGGGALS
jgi:hypothetical protein